MSHYSQRAVIAALACMSEEEVRRTVVLSRQVHNPAYQCLWIRHYSLKFLDVKGHILSGELGKRKIAHKARQMGLCWKTYVQWVTQGAFPFREPTICKTEWPVPSKMFHSAYDWGVDKGLFIPEYELSKMLGTRGNLLYRLAPESAWQPIFNVFGEIEV